MGKNQPKGLFESCNYEGTNLAIMNRNQSTVIVFSALSEFDSVMQARLNSTAELRTGIAGTIKSIPVGHTFVSFLHVGTDGINAAYKSWGDALLSQHGKKRTPPDASIVLSHLGYSSTAGYFYSPEGGEGYWPNVIPGKNYEETMLDVYAFAQKEKIPYRSILLDSWWYVIIG